MKIIITHEGQKHSVQLDNIPDLTVDKISSLISAAFGSKDKLLLMTNDNNILHPDIKFSDLLLINPGKYKYLKTFVSKDYSVPPSQMGFKNNNFNNYSSTFSNNTQPIKPTTFDIKNPLQKDNNDLIGNNIPSVNNNFSSYKFDKNLLNKDIPNQQRTNLNAGIGLNNPMRINNDNEQKDFMPPTKLQQPQKFSSERFGDDSIGISPTYKPFKTEQSSGIDKFNPSTLNTNIGGNNKMDFQKFHQFESALPKTQPQSFSNKFDLNEPSNIIPKDNKDLTGNNINNDDLNNPTTNYMFNSGEMYQFDPLKKANTKLNTPNNINIDDTQQKPFLYNTNNINPTTSSNLAGGIGLNIHSAHKTDLFSEPQPTQHKDGYKRFSSEKRTYRTERHDFIPEGIGNLGGNQSNNVNQDDFPPKFQKYSSSEAVVGSDLPNRFTSDKFSKYPTPSTSNPTLNPSFNKELKEENTGIGFAPLGNKFSLRANIGNLGTMPDFSYDKKTTPGQNMMGIPQSGRIGKIDTTPPIKFNKTDMFKMNMQMGNEENLAE